MYKSVCMWMVFFVAVNAISYGYAYSDIDICEHTKESDSNVLKLEFCPVTRNDIHILCPPDKLVVFKPVVFAVKENIDSCTKRVLTRENQFCCRSQDTDRLYDGGCLQEMWSSDDNHQYRQFLLEALDKCKHTFSCTLNGQLFNNLQRKIPTTKTYSSYIQVRHSCIKAPTDPVDICSSTSMEGHDIHIRGSFSTGKDSVKMCQCRVTAKYPITVRAVDVSSTGNGLLLISGNRLKNISGDQLPVFGLKEIFTARSFDITIEQLQANGYQFWLHLVGSHGDDICITCGESSHNANARSTEPASKVKSTPNAPRFDENGKKTSGYGEYTPMIYAGIGSGLTIVLTACIFGGYFICRYCMKKGSKRHPYEKPHDRQFSGQYDAVYGGMPHPPPEWMNTGVKQNQRTSTMRSLHKPMAPTLPPPNRQGYRPNDNSQSPQDLHLMATSDGVSDIDAFLGN